MFDFSYNYFKKMFNQHFFLNFWGGLFIIGGYFSFHLWVSGWLDLLTGAGLRLNKASVGLDGPELGNNLFVTFLFSA